MTFQPTRPTSFMGVRANTPANVWTRRRDPNSQDLALYTIGDLWYNETTPSFWILYDTGSFGALWVLLNTSSSQSILTINSVLPDGLGNFNLVAGVGISLTPGVNSITIDSTGTGEVIWNMIAVNTVAAVNNGYMANAGVPITLTLPAVCAFGDIVWAKDFANGGLIVQPGAGQTIQFNSSTAAVQIDNIGSQVIDSVQLVCSVANSRWDVISSTGNWNTI